MHIEPFLYLLFIYVKYFDYPATFGTCYASLFLVLIDLLTGLITFRWGRTKFSNSNRTPNSFCVSTSNEACPHSSVRCWGRHVLTVASQAGRKREWKIDRQSNTFSHVTKCVFNLPWSGVKKEKENAKRFCPFANDNDDDWNMRNMRPHTRIQLHTPTVGTRHVYLPRPSICCWILIAHRVAR